MRGFFAEKENILGFSGAIIYWIMEHYEAALGLLLSIVMVMTSITLQVLKIRAEIHKEQREKELHEKKLKNGKP